MVRLRGGGLLKRLVTSLVGAVLVIYGFIAALSPLPAGVPLIALGLIMIALANPAARPLVRRLRRKWRWFDAIVRATGHRAPKDVRAVVEETEPEEEAETGEEKAS